MLRWGERGGEISTLMVWNIGTLEHCYIGTFENLNIYIVTLEYCYIVTLYIELAWSIVKISNLFYGCEFAFMYLYFCICVLLHCNGGDRLVGVEYWEHFKHVLWTEEINQGIETQVRGNANGAGLTF